MEEKGCEDVSVPLDIPNAELRPVYLEVDSKKIGETMEELHETLELLKDV